MDFTKGANPHGSKVVAASSKQIKTSVVTLGPNRYKQGKK